MVEKSYKGIGDCLAKVTIDLPKAIEPPPSIRRPSAPCASVRTSRGVFSCSPFASSAPPCRSKAVDVTAGAAACLSLCRPSGRRASRASGPRDSGPASSESSPSREPPPPPHNSPGIVLQAVPFLMAAQIGAPKAASLRYRRSPVCHPRRLMSYGVYDILEKKIEDVSCLCLLSLWFPLSAPPPQAQRRVSASLQANLVAFRGIWGFWLHCFPSVVAA